MRVVSRRGFLAWIPTDGCDPNAGPLYPNWNRTRLSASHGIGTEV